MRSSDSIITSERRLTWHGTRKTQQSRKLELDEVIEDDE
jgi:hypothetical protein